MQPLSHALVTHIIQRAMINKKLSVTALSMQSGVPFSKLAMQLAGHAHYEAADAARLSVALGVDLGEVFAQYAYGLFRSEYSRASSLDLGQEAKEEKRATGREFLAFVATLVDEQPNETPTDLLVDLVCGTTLVPQDMARTAVLNHLNSKRRSLLNYDENAARVPTYGQ